MMIHRMSIEGHGRAVCGATKPKLSIGGVMVTCPDCLRLTRPLSREEAMAQLEKAGLKRHEAQDLTEHYDAV